MQLNPKDFNRFLRHIGQKFLYRRSFACPCLNPHSGAARNDCPQCHGKGTLWAEPVRAHAGVPSQKVQREWAQMGRWESGDLVLTIPSDSAMYPAGEFDRIIMLDGSDPFSITKVRGTDDQIVWAGPRINRIFWLDDNSNIVESALPQVDLDGNLLWDAEANQPPMGKQYSVTGTRMTEYYVYTSLSSDRPEHMGAKLPKKLVARKFDLFSR